MSPTPNIPSAGGTDDFSQRIQDEQAKMTGQQPAQQARQQASEQAEAAQSQTEGDQAQTEDQGTGPVGQGDYVAKRGDCISKIAKETGHFWETIWNDSGNSELRETRKDPNVLLPGDKVTIPELKDKAEDCATEQLHRFRRLGEPSKLRMRIMQEPEPKAGEDERASEDTPQQRRAEAVEDEPRANVPYTMEIDGQTFSGQTDEEGYIEQNIPGNAKRGKLILDPGTPKQSEVPLNLGTLGPISEVSGAKERLNNLGFDCGDDSEEDTPRFREALKLFQQKAGLEINGKLNQETRDKLQEAHGS